MSERGGGGAWRLLWEWSRPQRREVGWAFAMGITWSLAAVAVPLVARAGVDAAVAGNDGGALLAVSGALLLLALLKAGALRIRRYLTFTSSAWVAGRLRSEMFGRLHALDAGFHERTSKGRLLGSLSDDTQNVEQFGISIQVLMNNFVWAALILIALVALDPGLALLAVLPLPLVLVAARRFTLALVEPTERVRERTLALGATVADTVDGIAVVKGLGIERRQVERFERRSARLHADARAAADVRAWYTPLIESLPSLSLALVLLAGGLKVRAGTLSLGDFTAFNAYVVMALWPLRFTGVIVGQASRARLAVERIDELLRAQPTVAAPVSTTTPPAGPPALSLTAVRFGYDPAALVLDGLTLDVPAGQLVALAGATGSGKTTIAKLLTRTYDVQAGSVAIGGTDVRAWEPAALRDAVCTVLDDTFLFSRSIRDNLLLARPCAGEHELERAARLAGLHDVLALLEEGWHAPAGERGARLSGGQRQRVSVARALLADAPLLVLDDVTSALDARSERRFVAALEEIRQQRTVLLVSDREAVLERVDRVVLLAGGRVAADGTHARLRATSPAYRAFLTHDPLAKAAS
ncbi:ABC transporter ATP-binding protein [Conexibacter stalactiti]|uniref:ABC transporter ATP-binding protein n=1 Tax=Conexibacter stalactiti TaxID=1940611 RepID=A0ABU4HLU8_9ACTN|nr:ABC transporter ATP-binding protein [Conexibacter stalactiti]MDW5594281.1 ABC transporter ATP-binding protein [Conexibacter stalactiti]MEC5034923.1 ABC transporter ATP-binding protein [Conexibacter stalactiti]